MAEAVPKAMRNDALDAARGVLMGLGVLLHAANIYMPASNWIVSDPDSHPFFGLLAGFIHVFRMPAFFWISGYFCAMTYMRWGARVVMRHRTPRLLVPLLTTCLTLNLLQDLLVGWSRGLDPGLVLAAGLHLHHLWFLIDLVVFTGLSLALMPLAVRWLTQFGACNPPSWWRLFGPLLLVTYGVGAIVRLSGMGYRPLWGLSTLYELANYAPFFAGGLVMQLLPSAHLRFRSVSPWLFVPAAALAMWLESPEGPAHWSSELLLVGHLLAIWVSIGALLGLFGRIFTRPSEFTRLASDSAYSVYLFHHLLVVAAGLALVGLPLGPWLKFIMVCLFAGAGALGVHLMLLRRVPWLHWLFNGQLPQR